MRIRTIVALLLLATLCLCQQSSDPWPTTALVEADAFAASLQGNGKKPVILSVVFPVLYRAKRIPNSIFVGPGSKPEGIELLKKAVANLPKDSDLVLYCGCCPMKQCPNLRPAFRTLKELGFTSVRVLNIPTNMHTDWYTKNYPAETGDVKP
jgi:thiosulfate/3-mercaptopyruvate sulfurtransferase